MRNPRIAVLERAPELAQQVRTVAMTLVPRPEVVTLDRLDAAEDFLVASGPIDVLVAGPAMATRAGFARLAAMHDESPWTRVILAFSERPEAGLRDIIRTGALDVVQLPVVDRSLATALDRALGASRARAPQPSESSVRARSRTGRVYTVASATGGCGKTFYATNLAYFLHAHTGASTCLVDLDLQFGEVSTALRLKPELTIADLLSREDADAEGPAAASELAGHLDSYVVRHSTGIHVLAAPKDPSDADRIHPSDVSRVLEAVRSRFDNVIVDTPAALSEIVLAAFDLSDQLYVMGTLDLPSVRNMSLFLSTLDKLKIPADDVNLVLNKAETDVGITVAEVTELFAQGFSSVLPYAREVSRSVNLGSPILAASPNSEVSLRLAAGLVELLPEAARAAAMPRSPEPARHGRIGRLFRPILHPLG
ncbi:MAG: AAA family ATPase [Acidimicrobiales bacterium]